MFVTASIVIYKEPIKTLQKTIVSFLATPCSKKLYIIDNSPTNQLQNYFKTPEITYVFSGHNLGFGRGHNLILEDLKKQSDFHLILNPDVQFQPTVIPYLVSELQQQKQVAMIAPKVLFEDGTLQLTCRKHPTILELIGRRTSVFKNYLLKRSYSKEIRATPFFPEFIHGCFLLFKTDAFIEIKGFDERYFLYMEDADICKKITKIDQKCRFDPRVSIVHLHRKGSSKNVKLFFHHTISVIRYFLKWGI